MARGLLVFQHARPIIDPVHDVIQRRLEITQTQSGSHSTPEFADKYIDYSIDFRRIKGGGDVEDRCRVDVTTSARTEVGKIMILPGYHTGPLACKKPR